VDVDVLIVGAGPAGTALALELARGGVASTVLERSSAPPLHPKMDFLNARTMEHYARLGMESDIREHGVPEDRDFRFLWRRDLDGPILSDWRASSVAGQRADIAQATDGTMPSRAYQRVLGSTLEGLSRDHCRASELIDLREGVAVTGVEIGTDHARATLADGTELTARWLIGCDGARSMVRRAAGIGLDEQGPTVTHTDVYLRSSDPRLTRDGIPFLIICGNGMTMVSRDGDRTWTVTYPHLSAEIAAADPMDVVRAKAGEDFVIDEVLLTAQWEGRLAVAERYREGPVLLAGDAAHTFFPTGGHGANTGIGDAINLGWKLAAVLRGEAGDGLLDSYSVERRPVALFAREMCGNLLEVWRRFPALTQAGVPDATLACFLDHESHQINNLGIHFAANYADSPVVVNKSSIAERSWTWHGIEPSVAAGGRLPHVPLGSGVSSHDLLGPAWTLIDPDGRGGSLLAAAERRGLPLVRRHFPDEAARKVYGDELILVRPDQHIAWSDAAVPSDPDLLLDRVLGLGDDALQST
jgi:2-polyprenyl-6-methoxyphenol hydroxylase-like FAD-dependent oxidoreductase